MQAVRLAHEAEEGSVLRLGDVPCNQEERARREEVESAEAQEHPWKM